MKKIILLLLIFFPNLCFAQLPSEVKHLEIVSEVADTMALLNKADMDIINEMFYKTAYQDSLLVINDAIIANSKLEIEKLHNIINEQSIVISNKDTQIIYLKDKSENVVSDFEKQIKNANIKKTIWECVSGLEVIAIILLAIL